MLFDDSEDELLEEREGSFSMNEPDALPQPRFAVDMVGHKAVEQQLLDSINSGKIPHAMIFAGPQGIGKSTMAFRFIKAMLAAKVDTGPSLFGTPDPVALTSLSANPDDQSSRLVVSGGHPDLMVVERKADEAKGGKLKDVDVEQIREIPGFLHMTPFMGGWRMVIIDDADTMTRSSQNALLKVLEEPPKNSILILIAHRPGLLISTIKSRCRTLNFSTLTQDEFDTLIKRAMPALARHDMDALYNIAGGSIGDSLQLMQDGALKSLHQVTALMQTWPEISWKDIHLMAEVLGGKGNDDSALNGFQNMLLWICETMTRIRASGLTQLPVPINNGPYPILLNHYSLEGWSKICDSLKTHFATVKYGSLDRRHAIFGAFSILKSGEIA
jgi:DNA polymerase-3 subunit delta'